MRSFQEKIDIVKKIGLFGGKLVKNAKLYPIMFTFFTNKTFSYIAIGSL